MVEAGLSTPALSLPIVLKQHLEKSLHCFLCQTITPFPILALSSSSEQTSLPIHSAKDSLNYGRSPSFLFVVGLFATSLYYISSVGFLVWLASWQQQCTAINESEAFSNVWGLSHLTFLSPHSETAIAVSLGHVVDTSTVGNGSQLLFSTISLAGSTRNPFSPPPPSLLAFHSPETSREIHRNPSQSTSCLDSGPRLVNTHPTGAKIDGTTIMGQPNCIYY